MKKSKIPISLLLFDETVCCVIDLVFRYPVILERFSLRPGSGGEGKHCGGDGVIRKLLFRTNVVLSVLTERRSTRPYGLKGSIAC